VKRHAWLVLGLVLIVSGCGGVGGWGLLPVAGEEPIIMFQTYELYCQGNVKDSDSLTGFWCTLNQIDSTLAAAPFDSVPPLWIDSICFENRCSATTTCLQPLSSHQYARKMVAEGLGGSDDTLATLATLAEMDSIISHDKWWTSRFLLYYDAPLPRLCEDSVHTVTIYASLIDPIDRGVIARESKSIAFYIDKSY
jgi:hypothetical protein